MGTPHNASAKTISTPADLGAMVRSLRKDQRITQRDLAAFAQTGERFIVDLEAGKPTVQLSKVLQALDQLGMRLAVVPR
ncbi:hypothetical protein CF70_022350 [Cupriavidus sp. SK-3]|uniref:type II toxin-antitoxin system Y4mF family antitoxin n=1 Tax=Cupriavidus sp. SK-3 TaxID=1470558 RepID=UPI00045035EE|nr:type II toxin-antitoxin system Y4mF family antitoxin [Cupriavidus sp. SK-3]KDP83915.1 hypothetical protein CF70_022350 [Cupriavidus sp. SK-3]